MSNKMIFAVIIIVFLFSVDYVHSIDLIESDIKDYEFEGSRIEDSTNFVKTHNLKYVSQVTGTIYGVQLGEFNKGDFDTEQLDSWITIKTRKNNRTMNHGNSTIFVDKDRRYIFWRSGPVYISVIHVLQKSDSLDVNDPKVYPSDILDEYLALYPSDCNADGCVIEKEKSFEEIYTFDEPENLVWEVTKHFDKSFFCPQNVTAENIRKRMQKEGTFFNVIVTDDELTKFLDECGQGGFFNFKGITLSLEIKECFNNLSSFFTEIDIYSSYSGIKKDIVKECYIRNHFSQRFNSNTVQNYNKTKFDALLDNRTKEFIDFVWLKIDYPKPQVIEEKSDEKSGDGDNSGRDIINISCRPEFGDECAKQNESSVNESEQAIDEPESEVPSKSALEIIKAKIKSFFRWFI